MSRSSRAIVGNNPPWSALGCSPRASKIAPQKQDSQSSLVGVFPRCPEPIHSGRRGSAPAPQSTRALISPFLFTSKGPAAHRLATERQSNLPHPPGGVAEDGDNRCKAFLNPLNGSAVTRAFEGSSGEQMVLYLGFLEGKLTSGRCRSSQASTCFKPGCGTDIHVSRWRCAWRAGRAVGEDPFSIALTSPCFRHGPLQWLSAPWLAQRFFPTVFRPVPEGLGLAQGAAQSLQHDSFR